MLPRQDVYYSLGVAQTEELVHGRFAKIAVHYKSCLVCLRQRNAKISANGALALPGAGTGYHNRSWSRIYLRIKQAREQGTVGLRRSAARLIDGDQIAK